MDYFKKYAVLTSISGAIYIVWLVLTINGALGVLFLFLELLLFFLFILFLINHGKRRYELTGGKYSLRSAVDIFIPTKSESLYLIERSIESALQIQNPNIKIYVIDDGGRDEILDLCKKYQVNYLRRPNRTENAFKAAALNYAFFQSYGNYILTLDADQEVLPNILDDLLGHFQDDKVGLVASKQQFNVVEDDFNHDYLFYEYMQPGKNATDTGMSCGSGVLYRRSALQEIGGFQEWNVVEDLYTTYVLNTAGYKTLYIHQAFTKGEAPTDLKTIYKQRGTWALDTLRLFIWKAPLFNFKLSFRKRLHYFEMGYIYIVSALVVPSIYALNIYSLFSNQPILEAGIWYALFRFPALYFIIKFYDTLGQGDSSSRMWAALFPVYLKSFAQALLYKKPKYIVTKKGAVPKKRLALIIPQLFMISLGVSGIVYHLVKFGLTYLLGVGVFWVALMIYWLWPVVPKALALTNKNFVFARLLKYDIQ